MLAHVDVVAGFNTEDVSYTSIDSEALSSCTFMLLIGDIKNIPFGHLSHYSEIYDVHNKERTPAFVLKDII